MPRQFSYKSEVVEPGWTKITIIYPRPDTEDVDLKGEPARVRFGEFILITAAGMMWGIRELIVEGELRRVLKEQFGVTIRSNSAVSDPVNRGKS